MRHDRRRNAAYRKLKGAANPNDTSGIKAHRTLSAVIIRDRLTGGTGTDGAGPREIGPPGGYDIPA